jgi:hypothetical protein
MSNVLSDEKKQQVIALGKLGWTLRRIEQATGVRRETASNYLRAAGIGVRPSGSWGRRSPAKPANGVTTDFIRPFSEKPPIELPKPNPSARSLRPVYWNVFLGGTSCRNTAIPETAILGIHGSHDNCSPR